jgi:hypothetical protein
VIINAEGVVITSQQDVIHNAVITNAEGVVITPQQDAIHNAVINAEGVG